MKASVSSVPGAFYRYILLAAAIVTFGLIVVGSVVRTTGSGLGCGTSWPDCNGVWIPDLTQFHVLIEFSHRVLATGVVVLTLLGLAGAWTKHRAYAGIKWPVTLAVVFLVAQIILGMITVKLELPPLIVAVHLTIAQGIFACLAVATVMAWRAGDVRTSSGPLFRRAVLGIVATYVLIVSGAYLVASGSTGSCDAWPFCTNDNLIPATGRESIHFLHRILVALLGAVIAWVAHLGIRRRESRGTSRAGIFILAMLVIEIFVGALNPWLGFPASLRSVHLAFATALGGGMVVLASLAYGRGGRMEEAPNISPHSMPEKRSFKQTATDYLILTKPWIMVLLLFTALGGMVLAARGLPTWPVLLSVLVGGGLASGGASALNHFLDQDLDQAMKRTRNRPVANLRIPPTNALIFGLVLNVLAFVILWAGSNLLAALLTMSGSVFYVLVYTGWLKRSTTQNIVIGGAAGAIPPVVGWAAVTGGLSLPALYLFAIVFYWTPPHFWALSLLIKNDYAQAKVPMLPVVEGEEWTRWAILLYTCIVSAVTMLLYVAMQSLGYLYLGGAVILGGIFIYYALQLVRAGMAVKGDGIQSVAAGGLAILATRAKAVRLYKYSMLYLMLLFLVIMVASSV